MYIFVKHGIELDLQNITTKYCLTDWAGRSRARGSRDQKRCLPMLITKAIFKN